MAIMRRAAFVTLQVAGRVLDRGARAVVCLAAGTLPRSELSAAVAARWDGYAGNEAQILSGLMDWEKRWYPGQLRPEDHALLVGCGTGRDLIALLRLGYRVDGLELVPASAARARAMLVKLGLSAEVITGAVETAPLRGPYDAIVFSWYAYSYIPSLALRTATLARLRAVLAPGGRILLSYVATDGPERTLPRRLTALAASVCGADWRPEPGDKIWAGDDWRSIHYEHQFQVGELEREAAAAGLRVASHERDDDGRAVLTSA